MSEFRLRLAGHVIHVPEKRRAKCPICSCPISDEQTVIYVGSGWVHAYCGDDDVTEPPTLTPEIRDRLRRRDLPKYGGTA